eukprot:COSAG06_NODE_3676_length_5027_cov_4.475244_1_plen_69_part_10
MGSIIGRAADGDIVTAAFGLKAFDGGYRCVSRGSYRNRETGSWGVARAGTVTVESFQTESCCDYISVSG